MHGEGLHALGQDPRAFNRAHGTHVKDDLRPHKRLERALVVAEKA